MIIIGDYIYWVWFFPPFNLGPSLVLFHYPTTQVTGRRSTTPARAPPSPRFYGPQVTLVTGNSMVPGRAGRPEFESRGGKMAAAPVANFRFFRAGGRWDCAFPWMAENISRWIWLAGVGNDDVQHQAQTSFREVAVTAVTAPCSSRGRCWARLRAWDAAWRTAAARRPELQVLPGTPWAAGEVGSSAGPLVGRCPHRAELARLHGLLGFYSPFSVCD